MRYTCVYANATGESATESHYEDKDGEMVTQNVAPPVQPLAFSAMTPASCGAFTQFPAGWDGDWHPAPRRQYFLMLTGECESVTSDGDRRSHSPGCVALFEDTIGERHRTRVVGDTDVLAAVVRLPDYRSFVMNSASESIAGTSRQHRLRAKGSTTRSISWSLPRRTGAGWSTPSSTRTTRAGWSPPVAGTPAAA
jgi:hypothetical protein